MNALGLVERHEDRQIGSGDGGCDRREVDLDAWHVGGDTVAEYLLLVPHRALLEVEDDVQVTEVFGGRAQWVNTFACERL